jgi:hypothetical protein
MALLEGRYLGKVLSTDLQQTRNGAVQLIARCLIEVDQNGNAVPHFEMNAYLTLVKLDGSKIDSQITALKNALGWDGVPANLVGEGLFTNQVEFVLQRKTNDNGIERTNIEWINKPGSGKKDISVENRSSAMDLLGKALGFKALGFKPIGNQNVKTKPVTEENIPF